jgi:crotonobetainyl-CoA:carnitine CoA-transferase CaiB-like acyl-CoA transferase
LRRAKTGTGAYLDVAVADGVLSLMSLAIEQHAATGAEMAPGGDLLTGRYACYDVYPTRDGKWIAVGAIEPAFWANLCNLLGCERWIAHQTDDAVQDAVRADLRAAFSTRDRDDWVAELASADTCVAPVYEVAEVLRDPHFAARGAFADGHVAPILAGQR